jgi:hypothetical protein
MTIIKGITLAAGFAGLLFAAAPASAGYGSGSYGYNANSYSPPQYADNYSARKCWWKRVKYWDDYSGRYVWKRVRICR